MVNKTTTTYHDRNYHENRFCFFCFFCPSFEAAISSTWQSRVCLFACGWTYYRWPILLHLMSRSHIKWRDGNKLMQRCVCLPHKVVCHRGVGQQQRDAILLVLVKCFQGSFREVCIHLFNFITYHQGYNCCQTSASALNWIVPQFLLLTLFPSALFTGVWPHTVHFSCRL